MSDVEEQVQSLTPQDLPSRPAVAPIIAHTVKLGPDHSSVVAAEVEWERRQPNRDAPVFRPIK